MSAILDFLAIRSTRATPKRPLDRLVARYAREHHGHVSPLVGCFECLHGQPRATWLVRAAA